jgi:hypothetical protein
MLFPNLPPKTAFVSVELNKTGRKRRELRCGTYSLYMSKKSFCSVSSAGGNQRNAPMKDGQVEQKETNKESGGRNASQKRLQMFA